MSNLGNEHVDNGLLLRAMDEELSPRQAEHVKQHVDQCADCQARLERLRAVTSRVAGYHREAILPDAAVAAAERQKFMRRLEQAAEEPRRRWAPLSGLSTPRLRVAWGGAFSLLVLGGFMVWMLRSRSAAPRIVAPPVVAVAPPVEDLVARLAPEQVPQPVRRVVKKRRAPAASMKQKASPQVVASEESVTPFFALPFSDAALPLDQAGVIRVELPRSALTLAGLPVDENRRNERVHADLIVGMDGLARAIRFVR